MKKKYRLLKNSEFKEVMNNQNKYFTKNLVCLYKKDQNIKNIKIGISISKKKTKLSVRRNYLKRIFWFINQTYKLEKLPKFKCVFFYTKNFLENNLSIKDLNKDLDQIYMNLIKKNNDFRK